MAIVKAPAEERLAAVCEPLDSLLERFGFETAESLTKGNTRLTVHRRGVDTLDVSVEASERRFGGLNKGQLDASVTYFPNGDRERAQYVYNLTALGGTLKEAIDEFLHGPREASRRKDNSYLGLEPALGKWDAHYRIKTGVPKSLVAVAEQILAAYSIGTQQPKLSVRMLEGAIPNGAIGNQTYPLIYVTTPYPVYNFNGQTYFVVTASNHGLASSFEVNVTSPSRAPKDMDFGKMNAAVKEVTRALSS